MKNIIAALALVSFFATSTAFAGGDEGKKAKKSCCTKMANGKSCSKDAKACTGAKTEKTEKTEKAS